MIPRIEIRSFENEVLCVLPCSWQGDKCFEFFEEQDAMRAEEARQQAEDEDGIA